MQTDFQLSYLVFLVFTLKESFLKGPPNKNLLTHENAKCYITTHCYLAFNISSIFENSERLVIKVYETLTVIYYNGKLGLRSYKKI